MRDVKFCGKYTTINECLLFHGVYRRTRLESHMISNACVYRSKPGSWSGQDEIDIKVKASMIPLHTICTVRTIRQRQIRAEVAELFRVLRLYKGSCKEANSSQTPLGQELGIFAFTLVAGTGSPIPCLADDLA